MGNVDRQERETEARRNDDRSEVDDRKHGGGGCRGESESVTARKRFRSPCPSDVRSHQEDGTVFGERNVYR